MNQFHLALTSLFLIVFLQLPAAEGDERTQNFNYVPVRSTIFCSIQEDLAEKKLLGELKFKQLLLKQLEEYTDSKPEAVDLTAAYFEMIRLYGELGEFSSAEKTLRRLIRKKPGARVIQTARLELGRTLLSCLDEGQKIAAVDSALAGAYGYAHETRLRQNLASVLALNGKNRAARKSYRAIREMSLYREYPLRFKSMEIFVDYLSRIGTAFTRVNGKTFRKRDLDSRKWLGRPFFVHFWYRNSSLGHDLKFLKELRLKYPGLRLLSINVADTPKRVANMLEKYAPDWPQWHDPEGKLAQSLGISFMGLYVHEPKGILVDEKGKIALMPGREGAIELALGIMCPAGKRSENLTYEKIEPSDNYVSLKRKQQKKHAEFNRKLDVTLLERLQSISNAESDSSTALPLAMEIMEIAIRLNRFQDAERTFNLFRAKFPSGNGLTALRFIRARALIMSAGPAAAAGAVYRALGNRLERDDLYILLDLAAALSVHGDVPGARAAFEKIIEVTGGAGKRTWEGYIEALGRVGQEFDHFVGRGLKGEVVDTRSFAGRVLLVDLWGPWCHACIREMPRVYDAYQKYRSRGFEVLGVATRDPLEKVNAFLLRTGYPWPQVFDQASEIAGPQVVVGYPTTLLIDGNGRVRCIRAYGNALEIALHLLIDRKVGSDKRE